MTVRPGEKGAEVRQLQLLLGVPADGIYGSGTRAVVDVALRWGGATRADGVVDEQGWRIVGAWAKAGRPYPEWSINTALNTVQQTAVDLRRRVDDGVKNVVNNASSPLNSLNAEVQGAGTMMRNVVFWGALAFLMYKVWAKYRETK